MNSKLLFAAALATSLIGTSALADATTQRGEYDVNPASFVGSSSITRADVAADLAASNAARKALVGPNANRMYNTAGIDILKTPSTLTRAEVRDEVRQAVAAGTLQNINSEDSSLAARGTTRGTTASKFAQR